MSISSDDQGLTIYDAIARQEGFLPVGVSTWVRTPSLQQKGYQALKQYKKNLRRVVLKLKGCLDDMAAGWTDEEQKSKRRLAEFARYQVGSTIYVDFQPAKPVERTHNTVCISCILWEETDESFFTSVDIIYLLESLLTVRFTVEEKSRIRRNLEAFHPLTLSKGKFDRDGFFNVIMGFSHPKPRTISKDIKVFPWKVLRHALMKIIERYVSIVSPTSNRKSIY